MPQDISLLDRVVIASPCTASWAGMKGNERVRFCELCQLNVYNLSSMSRDEAERLMVEKEGKLCATFYQRRDGTIITRDCPIGLRALRRGMAKTLATIGAAAMFLVCAGLRWSGRGAPEIRMRYLDPFSRVCDWLAPSPTTAGSIVLPPPAAARRRGKVRILGGAMIKPMIDAGKTEA